MRLTSLKQTDRLVDSVHRTFKNNVLMDPHSCAKQKEFENATYYHICRKQFESYQNWKGPKYVITITLQVGSSPLLISNVISYGRSIKKSLCSFITSVDTTIIWMFLFLTFRIKHSKWSVRTWKSTSKFTKVRISCSATSYNSQFLCRLFA